MDPIETWIITYKKAGSKITKAIPNETLDQHLDSMADNLCSKQNEDTIVQDIRKLDGYRPMGSNFINFENGVSINIEDTSTGIRGGMLMVHYRKTVEIYGPKKMEIASTDLTNLLKEKGFKLKP